jgi:hypothetical protein
MTPRRAGEPGEREVAVELTAAALARIAPDELVVLDETAAEYFHDPEGTLRGDGGDSPMGSGITVAMVTPYLLSVASVVLPLLGTIAGEIAKDVAKDLAKEPLTSWVRRLIRRSPAEPTGPIALTAEQAARVRQAVLTQSYRLGLPSEQAALLADATLGSLHTRP